MEGNEFVTINLQYFQNVITISSALLLLVPTLIGKVFCTRNWKWAAYLAISGFIIALLGSIGAQVGLSYITSGLYFPKQSNIDIGVSISSIAQICMWSGFIIGIISLTAFIFRNLFQTRPVEKDDDE